MSHEPYHYISKLIVVGEASAGKSSIIIRLCEGRFSSQQTITIGADYGSRIVAVGPPSSLALGINNPTVKQAPDAGADPSSDSPGNKSSRSKTSRPDPPRSKSEQKRMKLQLWDTAGQEQYRSLTRSYMRGSSGAVLVFDITRRSTFDSVTNWLHDIRLIGSEDVVVILVGNKSDLADTSQSLVDDQGEETQPNKRAVSQEEAREWCRRNGVSQYVETSAKSGEGVERAFLEVAERIYQNIEANRYNLHDRRSGVKAAGAVAGSRPTGRTSGNEVILGVNEVDGMNKHRKNGWNGGCC